MVILDSGSDVSLLPKRHQRNLDEATLGCRLQNCQGGALEVSGVNHAELHVRDQEGQGVVLQCQCLHATTRAHFGHRRWKKKLYYVHCFGQTPFTSGRNCKTHQRVQPNVGGISPPPAMTPHLCIDRKH